MMRSVDDLNMQGNLMECALGDALVRLCANLRWSAEVLSRASISI